MRLRRVAMGSCTLWARRTTARGERVVRRADFDPSLLEFGAGGYPLAARHCPRINWRGAAEIGGSAPGARSGVVRPCAKRAGPATCQARQV